MTEIEAINLLKQVVSVYRGVQKEHEVLQEALKVLTPKLSEKPEKKKE